MSKQSNWRLTEDQKQAATVMYELGLAIGPIAKEFGVSRQSMWDVLHRRTTMRDRVEALPRKPTNSKRAKRLKALKRYRGRAARVTPAQVREVKARDIVCVKCGGTGTDIDHIVPVARGGQTAMENLQLLCNPCHRKKTGNEWRGVSKVEAIPS